MTPIPAPRLLDALNWRYATKVFDPERKIPAETWSALEQSLVLTPSSYGLQPWRFLVITDKPLRESLVPHAWKQRQVADCSHLVVMCTRKKLSEADVDRFVERMAEVRGGTADALVKFRNMMIGDVVAGGRSHQAAEWAVRQAYIALGQFMLSAALLGIDTCPMEGFIPEKIDEALDLARGGLTASVLCPAGYRSPSDRYSALPKVRFQAEDVIERH